MKLRFSSRDQFMSGRRHSTALLGTATACVLVVAVTSALVRLGNGGRRQQGGPIGGALPPVTSLPATPTTAAASVALPLATTNVAVPPQHAVPARSLDDN